MANLYQLKPCRNCGGPKERIREAHTHVGCYCEKCRREIEKKYSRNACGSDEPRHRYWECSACWEVKRMRRGEAARRSTATRARNHPTWQKPFNAEKFWQGRAHGAVQAAIKRGLLPSLKDDVYACADCGKPAIEYDHRDYGRPLDVDPVCRSCNHLRGTAIWPSADRYDFKRIGDAPSDLKRTA